MSRPLNYDDIRAAGYNTLTSGLRVVSGVGSRMNHAASTSNTVSLSYHDYRAAADIKRPRVLHCNWRVTTNTLLETDASAPLTVTDMIEFPIGQKLSQQVTSTAQPGAEAINDMGPLVIPKGALFRVWSLRVGPLVNYATLQVSGATAAYGHQLRFAADTSATALPTQPGQAVSTPSNGNLYAPVVLDETFARSVVLLDDSHGIGQGDTPLLTGQAGPFERFYDASIPVLNLSTGGASAASLLVQGNFTRRLRLLAYGTDIDLGLGGNDITNGRTAPQIIGDLKAIRDMIPAGKKVFTATELPKTASSDLFVTVANQTVTAGEADRLALNDFKRSGYFDYYHDFERAIGVANGAAIVWPVVNGAATTSDGIHGNEGSYSRVSLIAGPRLL